MVLPPLFTPGGLGSPELIIILLIAVLLFGANKIPKLARSTGQAIGEFQRGRQELEEELEEVEEAASLDEESPPPTDDETSSRSVSEDSSAEPETTTDTESTSGDGQ